MAFHVFVEGAVDASPSGIDRLAQAMSARYGLPAADLVARLAKGRFRVKANVDQKTAETYRDDLRAIGARVTIEAAAPASGSTLPPATARTSTQPKPASTLPPARGSTLPPATAPKPAGSTLPPANAPRPATSVLPPRASTDPATSGLPARAPAPAAKPSGSLQSGLAAAFSGELPAASLGALEGGALSLAALDGDDDKPAPPPASFEPAPPAASFDAALEPAPPAKPAPVDLFAPPDQESAEVAVALAPDERSHKRTSTPPATRAPEPAARISAPLPATPIRGTPSLAPTDVPVVRAPRGLDPRARWIIGVVLAIGLGFVPAHLFAAMREKSAFKAIDDKVVAVQAQADTPEAYDALDTFRAEQLERKQSERRNIALLAFAIWAVAGGGIAYGWFRTVR